MSKVLIYSGTTEGRNIAGNLGAAGIYCDVCVATEYGEQVMEESDYIRVLSGRLDVKMMCELYDNNSYDAVVDATHPFATAVSENIKESLGGYNIPLLRCLRETSCEYGDNIRFFDRNEDCVEELKKREGIILLTTGSKELSIYCRDEALRKRLVVRVIPGMESIKLCYDNGLEGKQIVAMQGPFSKDMNLSILKQYNISYMVTKESGKKGGVNEKIEAARELNIPCFIIKKPVLENGKKTFSEREIYIELGRILGVDFSDTSVMEVTLAGIGMGSAEGMTVEVKKEIEKADYLFGAERMIKSVCSGKKTYPYYRSEDIMPVLDKLRKENFGKIRIAVLFSGDTGFFSGCEGLYNVFSKMDKVNVKILPGISSISCIAARIGISLQDANIVNAHGVCGDWKAKLFESVKYNKKTFLLTSGYKDINEISNVLGGFQSINIWIAYQMSYENDMVREVTIEECSRISGKGLYVCVIINHFPEKKVLSPMLKDSDFIRDKVPMTKEEIRHISVCRLRLSDGAVVYDIGSGTGSIAIEMAALSAGIKVYAVEINDKALELINENVNKFGVSNVNVIKGMAPDIIKDLPDPTHVFIGGSKGNLREIIEELVSRKTNIRVVMNAISMESVCEIHNILKEYPFGNVEVTQVGISRVEEVGTYHLLKANNSVFVISFDMIPG